MKRRRLAGLLGFALTLAATLLLAGCPTERTSPPSADTAARPALQAATAGLAARLLDPDQDERTTSQQPARPLRKDDAIAVSFDRPMVAAAEVDRPVALPPVELSPALPSRFRWRSPTEGELTVTATPAPATAYTLRLRSGLRDAAGSAVAVPGWGLRWPEALYVVRLPWSPYSRLILAQPSLMLEFSHPTAAAEVARTALWRDDSGRTVGSEVQVYPDTDPKSALRFMVTPVRPLPTGRSYELLVEGTRCAVDGSRLAYVHVFPVGRTEALSVDWVAGRHQPKLGTFVEIGFNQPLDAASVSPAAIAIEPAVAPLRLETEWGTIRVFGDFDPAKRYRVAITRGIRSRRGFPLAAASTWSAHFGDKRPAVILSRSLVTTTARQGLSLDLVQVNTGPLRWRLARVPVEALASVRARLDEYRTRDGSRRDPAAAEDRAPVTELLVPALKLPVVAEGGFDATSGDREVPRTVATVPDALPEGAYLFEIAGPTADGRTAGNRALVFLNREFLVWKTSRTALAARLFDVVSGDPVPQADISILGDDGRQLGRATTDATGTASLPPIDYEADPALVLVRRGNATTAHFMDLAGGIPRVFHNHDDDGDEEHGEAGPVLRQWLFSDRGIYRPGETLRAKGIVREVRDGRLEIPAADTPVAWELVRLSKDEPVLTGETTLTATGSWEAEIALPANLPTGHYELRALGARCEVKLDEFRAPPFAAEVSELPAAEPGASRVRVLSRYFHGAPNARAAVRWRAVWSPFTPEPAEGVAAPDRWLSTRDYGSPARELRAPRGLDAEGSNGSEDAAASRVFEGTATLDADGAVELSSRQPFPTARNLAAAGVQWEVAVVAPDGQTVDTGAFQVVPVAPAQPAVSLDAPTSGHAVEVFATAIGMDGAPAAGTPLEIELFHVDEKTVRENLSRHVVRYRNTPLFASVATRSGKAPFRETIRVPDTGRYVAVVRIAGCERSPLASTDVSVAGELPAEFAQWDDSSFDARPDRTEYRVGATARIELRAPFAGMAWVTVETDRILYSNLVRLPGNAASVEIPVTAEMHPGAQVLVHLFRPESLGAPAERRAQCALRVVRPETELRVAVEPSVAKVEPGNAVSGTVSVNVGDAPAADAEVTLFAVDEAVLQYGRWSPGDAAEIFFPAVPHRIETRSSLRQFGPARPDDPLFQKGFILGDGAGRPVAIRRRFAALAFWQGVLRTDAAGRASFSFVAPDNLTAYRIVAIAHRGTEQFGHGAKLVEVSRRLQAEPALPRFVRSGDRVDLRVLLRQNEWPALPVRAECSVEGATLDGADSVSATLQKALPQPAVFPAAVPDGADTLKATFAVQAQEVKDARDSVELVVPVKPARIVRREAVAGALPASGAFPDNAVPERWRHAEGSADLVVSTSPWLPVLDALPRLLDYPHGCDEQVSARVLAYALMADLLDALPDDAARSAEYRRRVETGLAALARAQLAGGDMPYWPGQTEPNAFVTIQTAWAAAEAARSGFRASPLFVDGLQNALRRIVRREDRVRVAPVLRAFALMVSATIDPARRLRAEALDTYQQRDALGDDGRAFLALALHRFGIMPDEQRQLLAELGDTTAEADFAAGTFASAARTTTLRLLARAEIAGADRTAAERAEQRRRFEELLGRSTDFSTQENLWLLLAFRAFVRAESPVAPLPTGVADPRMLRSADGRAAGWYGVPLAELPSLLAQAPAPSASGGSYLVRAAYRLDEPERREDRGLRLERVVRNLTDAARDGSAAAPFALGDELLVTFRVFAERSQAYVALEESLPAAFETVDPEYLRLALRERLGEVVGENRASLSHWEKRDDRTLWYFDSVGAGTLAYGVVVRVTSSGSFQWPGAFVSPMYDHRFSGTSEGGMIEVRP
jgi:uncharacterized protein YfaS (alpha-2-macroglobulin family)